MEWILVLIGFLSGMLLSAKIIEKIDKKADEKSEEEFRLYKSMRAKQFMSELDEMNAKPYEFWSDKAETDFNTRSKKSLFSPHETERILKDEDWYVTNPKTKNPIDFMKERDKDD